MNHTQTQTQKHIHTLIHTRMCACIHTCEHPATATHIHRMFPVIHMRGYKVKKKTASVHDKRNGLDIQKSGIRFSYNFRISKRISEYIVRHGFMLQQKKKRHSVLNRYLLFCLIRCPVAAAPPLSSFLACSHLPRPPFHHSHPLLRKMLQ